MQLLDDAHGVGGTIEEIGVAEGDVLCAGRHLTRDVLQHDVWLHDEEPAAVDRDDRAVAAEMLAAAAGFGVAGDARAATGQLDVRVPLETGKQTTVRHEEPLPVQGDRRFGLCLPWRGLRFVGGEPLDQRDEPLLELTAEDRPGAELAQILLVHRRIQTVEAEVGVRVDLLHTLHKAGRQPGGGVHWHVERHQVRGGNRRLVQALDGQIEAGDPRSRLAQPGRGRRQTERLMPQLVG